MTNASDGENWVSVRRTGTGQAVRERIVAEAARLPDDPAAYAAMAQAVNPYGDGQSAERVVKVLVGKAQGEDGDRGCNRCK